MAAIDPKQVILSNKVLVGLYVAALLPIPLWFVLVANGVRGNLSGQGSGPPGSYGATKKQLNDAKALAGSMADKIGNAEDPLYTQTDVERLEKRKQMMSKQLDELRKIVKAADQSLESWFDAFSALKEGQIPVKDEFTTEWNKQVTKLKEEFKPVLTTDTGENLAYTDLPPGGADQLRVWQKRYWIQEAVLQALTDANKSAPGPTGHARLQSRMDFGASGPKLGDIGSADDAKGPPPPYDPIDVRLSVRAPLSRMPVVVRELLARKIPLRVKAIRYETPAAFAMDHQKPRLTVDGKEGYFVQDTYFAKVDVEEAKGLDLNDQARWIWEPPVVVELQLEVYDFRKEATEAPAPPPAPAEGEGGEGGAGQGG